MYVPLARGEDLHGLGIQPFKAVDTPRSLLPINPTSTVFTQHFDQPSRSSKPFPRLGVAAPPGRFCPVAAFGVGAMAPGRGAGVEAAAPQMPALLFAFARLARSGPLLGVPARFWIPAVTLADDQSEPNASPPLDFDALVSGLPRVAALVEDPKLGVEVNAGLEKPDEDEAADDALMVVLTDV